MFYRIFRHIGNVKSGIAIGLFLLNFLLIQGTPVLAADSLSRMEWITLPAKKLIPIYAADGRAHRLSVQHTAGTNEFIGSMGGAFPVMQVNKGKYAAQFSVASTLYTTLKQSLTHGTLINTDFFVDLFLDLKLSEQWAGRVGMGHTSQHLSDDALILYRSINYARDYYALFITYRSINRSLLIYSGMQYNHSFKTSDGYRDHDLSGGADLQLGFEHATCRIGKLTRFYYAGDLKLRGELNYRTTQRATAGVKIQDAVRSDHVLRFALSYNWGLDERGQFYLNRRNFYTTGLYFEF